VKIVGVISGKGGVGKTTTVANVGIALASKFKRKAAVLDGNPTTPDLGLHLGMYNFSNTIEDVLRRKVSINQALYDHSSGVRLIPSSLSHSTAGVVDFRDLKGILNELEEHEFLLIDSPPGLGREITLILEACDEVLIVTAPELPAITDTIRAILVAKEVGVPIRGIVLNRMMGETYELSVIEVEAVFDVPVIGVIPEDAKVRESIAIGNPVVLNNPYSPAAIGFKKLAAYLIGEEYTVGFFAKIKSLLMFWKKPPKREVAVPEVKPPEEEIKPEEIVKPEIKPEEPVVIKPEEELEPTLTALNARKKMLSSVLDKLKKKYDDGQVPEWVYNKLKYKYEEEFKRTLHRIEGLKKKS
jgi:septum site-determining protein MinD